MRESSIVQNQLNRADFCSTVKMFVRCACKKGIERIKRAFLFVQAFQNSQVERLDEFFSFVFCSIIFSLSNSRWIRSRKRDSFLRTFITNIKFSISFTFEPESRAERSPCVKLLIRSIRLVCAWVNSSTIWLISSVFVRRWTSWKTKANHDDEARRARDSTSAEENKLCPRWCRSSFELLAFRE